MDSHDKIFLDMYIISCMYAPKAPKQKKHTTTERYARPGKYKILAFQNNLNQPASTDHNPPHGKINIFLIQIPTSFPTKSSFAKPLFFQNHPTFCVSSVFFPSFIYSAFGTNAFTVFQGPSVRIIAGSAIAGTSSLNGGSCSMAGTSGAHETPRFFWVGIKHVPISRQV